MESQDISKQCSRYFSEDSSNNIFAILQQEQNSIIIDNVSSNRGLSAPQSDNKYNVAYNYTEQSIYDSINLTSALKLSDLSFNHIARETGEKVHDSESITVS